MTGISTGRPDYDQMFRMRGSEGGPVFIIKGHDKVGGDAIRAYAALAHKAGAPDEVIELALQQADAVDRWPQKKVADGPDLDEGARKQLRYQLGRRAWNARAAIEDHHPALADKLASDAIASNLRPLVTALIERIPPADRPQVLEDLTHPLHGFCRLAGWDLAGRFAAA